MYNSLPPQVSLLNDVIGWCEGGGRPGALVKAYSIHGLQVFQGFPRAGVGHGKKLTGCDKADHGLCTMCQLLCRGSSWAVGQLSGGQCMGTGWSLAMTRRSSKVGTSWQMLDPTCMERPCVATPRACFPLMAIRSTHQAVIGLPTRGSGRVELRGHRCCCWRTQSVWDQTSWSGSPLAPPCCPPVRLSCLSRTGQYRTAGTPAHVYCTARVLGGWGDRNGGN